ncbi:DUF7507 domain-containing protein [Paenibacillus hexagrammi]|uniref:DUF11 domain-containing protein n=1 Tax=Paenibacillus hexagrammi TaxID=2908839 RepID=A0ABY3SRB3_9BACL|nr:hypothetical protein [Paenibacillus sp. YPD9-1]UJF35799.1 hypothetical protein L0M14_12345 [Paenibacillus sp. YPD9-1]
MSTNVYQPILNAVKSANTSNATVGDTVVYTVNVSNTGNIPAALTFTDTIPNGTTFVPNSVIINGVPLTGAEPAAGFSAGTVAPGATTRILFSVVIDSLPTQQQISNQGTVSYTFIPPDGVTRSGSIVTNTVTFPVSAPNVTLVKSSNATDAVTGDVITYSIVVTNSGIEPVNDVRFVDPIPAGTQLVPNSVTVAGSPVAGASPATGVTIGTIAPGGSVTVTFRVTVTSVLDPATITNRSSVSFTSGSFSGVAFSNDNAIPLYEPIINLVKSTSEARATVGDTIVYTLVVSNSGNLPAQVTVFDAIPTGADFVPNSIIVNGVAQPGATPDSGISIGTVSPGEAATVTLTLQASVETLPASQQLTNQASANYSFTPPDGRTLTGTSSSNIVTIPVSSPDVTVVKSTTATDAVVGDVIPYSITVTNSGFEAITNAVLTDPLPAGTQFVTGSVTVGGESRPSASPNAGIQLGTIAAGSFVIVTFRVTVISLPNPAVIENRSVVGFSSGTFNGTSVSNTVTTPVYQPIVAVVKSADRSNVTVGNTVTYTLAVTNSGNLAASVTLTDPIPSGTEFVDNSVVVDGVPQPGANPAQGISIGVVQPGDTVVVRTTFQVTVETLPNPQQLVNQASADFTFTPPDGRLLTGSVTSNTLTIAVSSPNVTVAKSTSAIDAVVGDTLTYTVIVTNAGIDTVNNVVLIDPVPLGARFISGTVIVDGVQRPSDDPNTGINIGAIPAGGSSIVTFEVTVV